LNAGPDERAKAARAPASVRWTRSACFGQCCRVTNASTTTSSRASVGCAAMALGTTPQRTETAARDASIVRPRFGTPRAPRAGWSRAFILSYGVSFADSRDAFAIATATSPRQQTAASRFCIWVCNRTGLVRLKLRDDSFTAQVPRLQRDGLQHFSGASPGPPSRLRPGISGTSSPLSRRGHGYMDAHRVGHMRWRLRRH
jgi:hypothetical protein